MDKPEKKLRRIQLQKFSARYGGAVTVLTYLCGTTKVHKQGTTEVLFYVPEVHYIVHGTPAI
jgi:hypothetical protein